MDLHSVYVALGGLDELAEKKMQNLPSLSLVIGGARSGKSAFAERLVGRPGAVYIATAHAYDDEMRAKIERHKADRGEGWTTIETPHDLCGAVSALPKTTSAVLIDCATLWLSNRLLAGADLQVESDQLVKALIETSIPIVVVSNEVGWSVVPENKLARQFRDEQGRLNQALANHSDLAVAVMAGCPITLKGVIPS